MREKIKLVVFASFFVSLFFAITLFSPFKKIQGNQVPSNAIGEEFVETDKTDDTVANYEKIVMEQNDNFALLLKKSRIPIEEHFQIISSLSKVVNLSRCSPKDYCEIIYNKQTKLWDKIFFWQKGAFYYVISRNENGSIYAEKIKQEIKTENFVKRGVVQNSLWEAMSGNSVPPDIILLFADIFAWQIDFFTGVQNGDEFTVYYEVSKAAVQNLRVSSNIIAAQYKNASKRYYAFRFEGKKGEGYYDENGKSLRGIFLKAPLQYRRISSYFSKKRLHPILKYVRPHLGIDYVAPQGTPVSTVASGTIKKSGYSGGFGNLVIIQHSRGYETYYGHLSKYAKGIRKGASVKQGQTIGFVGSTGLATGPHLDFRIKRNGKFFNFLSIRTISSESLSESEILNFKEHSKKLLNKLNFME